MEAFRFVRFRTPKQMKRLQEFLVKDPLKKHVEAEFSTGFVSHFEYPEPVPLGSVSRYPPLTTPRGTVQIPKAISKQVLARKRIRGVG